MKRWPGWVGLVVIGVGFGWQPVCAQQTSVIVGRPVSIEAQVPIPVPPTSGTPLPPPTPVGPSAAPAAPATGLPMYAPPVHGVSLAGSYPPVPAYTTDPGWVQPRKGASAGCPNCNKDDRPDAGTRPPRPLMNAFGVGCWSHPNMVTCGSLRSHLSFIFSSCKTFYGEPCLLSTPAIPVPPGYENTPIHYP